jgi:FlaG/FlaF family flagellin (archaellin)
MKNKRLNQAASEIVSVILLLAIAIGLFASVQYIVYSYPYEPSPPSLDLVGSINDGVIFIEHQGGEALLLNAQIRILIGDSNQISIIAEDYLDSNSSDNDEYWEIGETIAYNPHTELNGVRVETTVVDKETNSVVMNGIIQGGQF